MTIESELRGIQDMRETVHTWIAWRPTIHHTPESLTGILNDELTELREAVTMNRPQAEITAEVGDVLFSTLALDTGHGKYKSHYSTIARYCKLSGTSFKKLFDDTNFKNEVNYPIYLFHRPSPFINSSDAISCLRVLRKIDKDPGQLVHRWVDSKSLLHQLPFMDAYEVSHLFRNFVKDSIIKIKQDKKTDSKTVQQINDLLSVGQWNSVPLDLDIDKPQNDLILF